MVGGHVQMFQPTIKLATNEGVEEIKTETAADFSFNVGKAWDAWAGVGKEKGYSVTTWVSCWCKCRGGDDANVMEIGRCAGQAQDDRCDISKLGEGDERELHLANVKSRLWHGHSSPRGRTVRRTRSIYSNGLHTKRLVKPRLGITR